MPSPTSTLLTALSLASILQSTTALTTTYGGSSNNGIKCPGVLQVSGSDSDGTCCVGGKLDLSTCEGWPICTGSTREPKSVSCATRVPVTAKDYSSIIESASSKYLQGSEASATDDSMPSATGTGESSKQAASATATNSDASPSETGNSSVMKMPNLVGGVVGSILALWVVM
ncbi:Ff.00g002380.m01.CDS01 [Fusarium sp. VM40]|nr:Ff.00g002380.m01.CDS01 [Fusarium sp. VM40]